MLQYSTDNVCLMIREGVLTLMVSIIVDKYQHLKASACSVAPGQCALRHFWCNFSRSLNTSSRTMFSQLEQDQFIDVILMRERVFSWNRSPPGSSAQLPWQPDLSDQINYMASLEREILWFVMTQSDKTLQVGHNLSIWTWYRTYYLSVLAQESYRNAVTSIPVNGILIFNDGGNFIFSVI